MLHASLTVTDLDRSLAFYQAVFGARIVLLERGMSELIARITGLPGPTCDLAKLSIGDGNALLELITFHDVPAGRDDHAPIRPGHGHICIGVTDLNRVIALAERHGATPGGEIVAYPESRAIYQLRTPGGRVLEVAQ